MEKSTAEIVAELRATLKQAEREAVTFADSHPLEYVVYCSDGDYAPFRTDGRHIALVGGEIWSHPSRAEASDVANGLWRAAVKAGSKMTPRVMIAQAWASHRMFQLQKLAATLNEQGV